MQKSRPCTAGPASPNFDVLPPGCWASGVFESQHPAVVGHHPCCLALNIATHHATSYPVKGKPKELVLNYGFLVASEKPIRKKGVYTTIRTGFTFNEKNNLESLVSACLWSKICCLKRSLKKLHQAVQVRANVKLHFVLHSFCWCFMHISNMYVL